MCRLYQRTNRRHQEKALAALAEREARAAAAREEAQRQADAQQDPEDEDTTSDSDKENADEEQEDFPHDNDGTFQPEDTDFSSQPERLLAPKETTDQNPEAITLQQGFNRMSASINDFEFSQELSDLSDDRAKSSTVMKKKRYRTYRPKRSGHHLDHQQ